MRPAPVHEGSGRLLQTMSARGAERVTAEVLPSIDRLVGCDPKRVGAASVSNWGRFVR